MIGELNCKKCGYSWLPRVKEVKMCPACKNRDFQKRGKRKYVKRTVGVDKGV